MAEPAARRPLRLRRRRAPDRRSTEPERGNGPARPRPRRALVAVGRARRRARLTLAATWSSPSRATRSRCGSRSTTARRRRPRRSTLRATNTGDRGRRRSAPACTRTSRAAPRRSTTACSRCRRARASRSTSAMLPTGPPVPVGGTDLDFRRARRIGAQRLDTCFGDLDRDPARRRPRPARERRGRAAAHGLDGRELPLRPGLHGRRRRRPGTPPRAGSPSSR